MSQLKHMKLDGWLGHLMSLGYVIFWWHFLTGEGRKWEEAQKKKKKKKYIRLIKILMSHFQKWTSACLSFLCYVPGREASLLTFKKGGKEKPLPHLRGFMAIIGTALLKISHLNEPSHKAMLLDTRFITSSCAFKQTVSWKALKILIFSSFTVMHWKHTMLMSFSCSQHKKISLHPLMFQVFFFFPKSFSLKVHSDSSLTLHPTTAIPRKAFSPTPAERAMVRHLLIRLCVSAVSRHGHGQWTSSVKGQK